MKIDRLNTIRELKLPTAEFVGFRASEAINPQLIRELLIKSRNNRVNVRSYTDDLSSKSNPFVYGLYHIDDVLDEVAKLRQQGYNIIVNETIDKDDGGVSGVIYNGIMEFAPRETPRTVEKSDGIARLPSKLGLNLLKKVYNFGKYDVDLDILVDNLKDIRTEFSVHPTGNKLTVWDLEPSFTNTNYKCRISTESRMSELIGHKTFGLLVADCLGLKVPKTRVKNVYIPDFEFGGLEGEGVFTRTAPSDRTPGKFATMEGYCDSSILMNGYVPTVLYQDKIEVAYSGTALCKKNQKTVIEGVKGIGSNFMLGKEPPGDLPIEIIYKVEEEVDRVFNRLEEFSILDEDILLEWGVKDDSVVIFQLVFKNEDCRPRGEYIVEPDTTEDIEYTEFYVENGVEGLLELLETNPKGVILKGNVGYGSHLCDILRERKIVSKIVI